MKKTLLIFLYVVSISAIQSGCTSTPCMTGNFNFGLVSFSEAEADTILVRRYFPGNNFSLLADSFMLQPQFARHLDTLEFSSVSMPAFFLTAGYDYQLTFPGAGRDIRIAEIKEEKREFKHSIFNNVKVGCENSITSMKADGHLVLSAGFNNFYFSR